VLTNQDLPDRIMVVDDDPSVADVVGRYLVRDGHQVEYARDGRTALQRIAEQPPDLVVLDLKLPGIDGLEVCRQLRAGWPIPVAMLTAPSEETDRVVGLESGPTGLGLIARGIIEAYDGQIGVRNTGPGCEFVIRLPLAAHRPETDGKASELAVSSLRPPKGERLCGGLTASRRARAAAARR
jgi:CheY-like chemotaxis protein